MKKSSLSLTVGEGNLPGSAFHNNHHNRDFHPSPQLADATQDIQDMRNCYNGLLSAANATANSAYEFSESLREMGSCLLEKTALHHDAETCKVLLMLGKVQFELQKLVDNYRNHILLTITNPAESLLNELTTVEDMKRQYDEKRNVYEYMMTQQKEKGRLKGETFTPKQLQTAHDEYNEEATLCVFRLKSLKQGQSRSLLTQAARHHAAQLNFFRKGLKSLEEVETHVRMVTEKQHIDYQFSGLEDDDGEDGENSYDTNEEGELSSDSEASEKGFDVTTVLRNSMEIDEVGISFPLASKVGDAELNLDKSQEVHVLDREHRPSSYSAPIFPERKFDSGEKVREMLQSSKRKSHTYVLPTPIDSKSTTSLRTIAPVSHIRPASLSGHTHNLWHSSPLEQKKHEKDSGEGQQAELTTLKAQFVSKESDSSDASMQLPLPLAEGRLLPQQDTSGASDAKKTKRKAVSGPLTGKQSSTKPVLLSSGPIIAAEVPQLGSGILYQLPNPQLLLSPISSPTASPPLASSPRLNELHELPRPPAGSSVAKAAKSPGVVGHSAPLGLSSQEVSMINGIHSAASSAAARLPTPPFIVPWSFSTPSSSQRAMALHVSRQSPQTEIPFKNAEIASSPPLTPISFANMKAAPPSITEVASHNSQIRD